MVATGLLLALSLGVGLVYAALAFRTLRSRPARRKRKVLLAASIPVLSAIYLWFCIALLPGETLFGDISQPLPNGFLLQGLGKMPDFASISKAGDLSGNGPTECVGSLGVYGDFVVGHYSHPFGAFAPHADEGYFVLDTRNGTFHDYPALSVIEDYLGHDVHLVDTAFFRVSSPLTCDSKKKTGS
jgi:hypothetical protein